MGSFSDAAYGQIFPSLKNMLITYKPPSNESKLNIAILNSLKTTTKKDSIEGEVVIDV